MPYFVAHRAANVLNGHGKPLKNSKIFLLGLSYKPQVDDDRESPTYRIMAMLEQKGASVFYNDPFIPEIRPSREFAAYAGRRSADISGDYDLIILCTAHSQYNNINPEDLSAPVLDTRGILPDVPAGCTGHKFCTASSAAASDEFVLKSVRARTDWIQYE